MLKMFYRNQKAEAQKCPHIQKVEMFEEKKKLDLKSDLNNAMRMCWFAVV